MSYGDTTVREITKLLVYWVFGIIFGIVTLFAGIYSWQSIRLYIAGVTVKTETLRGEAELKRAEQNRQIQVQQAQAERDAAELRAEAIEIVGQAAQDFPEYRYQEFLGAFAEALNNGSIDQIVYIPTEANIPITDAGRLVRE